MEQRKRCKLCGDRMNSRAKYPYCRRSKACKQARDRCVYRMSAAARATILAARKRYHAAHRDAINARRRERWVMVKILRATVGS